MQVAYGSNGCTDTAYQTVTITTVGIDQLQNAASLSVYPNPVKNNLMINFGTLQNTTCTIKINSILGQTVRERKLIASETKNNFSWNIADLAPGVYTVIIESAQNKYIQKVIKQ